MNTYLLRICTQSPQDLHKILPLNSSLDLPIVPGWGPNLWGHSRFKLERGLFPFFISSFFTRKYWVFYEHLIWFLKRPQNKYFRTRSLGIIRGDYHYGEASSCHDFIIDCSLPIARMESKRFLEGDDAVCVHLTSKCVFGAYWHQALIKDWGPRGWTKLCSYPHRTHILVNSKESLHTNNAIPTRGLSPQGHTNLSGLCWHLGL